jgi:hypothetical protein
MGGPRFQRPVAPDTFTELDDYPHSSEAVNHVFRISGQKNVKSQAPRDVRDAV